MILRDPSWLLGYKLSSTGASIIPIPIEYDACQRIDFADGVFVGMRDWRAAELMDELERARL